MLPTHGRTGRNRVGCLPPLSRRSLEQVLVQVKAVPADNRILHQPLAGISYLLFLLARIDQLPVLAIEDRPREVISALQFVELLVDALAQGLVIQVTQQELGAHGAAQLA